MSEKRQLTIFVLDDDVQLVDTVTTLLESVGYSTAYAYQTEPGMELIRQTKPDLILLDIMFAGPPGQDGVELSRQLHRDPELKEIPIVILSGVRKVLDFEFDTSFDPTWLPVKAFLEKPIKPEELLAAIKRVLGPRE
jgi:twitching motility two-component system response regulator PilH